MAKPKRTSTGGWTASQVVAHNLTEARELRGLTQTEVAERLSRFTGTTWTATTVAQAEGSVSGNRVRQFTANELAALARTFDLPVLYFFMPPEDGAGGFHTADAGRHGWEYLLLLLWGHSENFPILAGRAAPWAQSSPVLVPRADSLGPLSDNSLVAKQQRTRNQLSASEMLGAAFHGLARQRIRGSIVPGEDLDKMIDNLRGLAEALKAFKDYSPGGLFDTELLRQIAARAEIANTEEET